MDGYLQDNGNPSTGGDVVSTPLVGNPGAFGGLAKTWPAADITPARERDTLTGGDIVVHAKGA